MRKIEIIFSQTDKELAERLHCKHEKLADKYLALSFIFKIIAGIILSLSVMLYFLTVDKSSYTIAAVWITFISAIISLLISFIFQLIIHDDYFAKSLRYQFMLERMQEISKYGNSLEFSVSKAGPNIVTYNLPDCRCRYIEAVNNIPADGNIIITVKEDVDAKNRISLDWYAKTV